MWQNARRSSLAISFSNLSLVAIVSTALVHSVRASTAGAFYLMPVGCRTEGYLSVRPCGSLEAPPVVVAGDAKVPDANLQWLLRPQSAEDAPSGGVVIEAVGRTSCGNTLSASSKCASSLVSVSNSSAAVVTDGWELVQTEEHGIFLIKWKGRGDCAAEYLGVSCGSGSVQLLPKPFSKAARSITWMLVPAEEGTKLGSCPAPSLSTYDIISSSPVDLRGLRFTQIAASVTLKPTSANDGSNTAGGLQPGRFAFVLQFSNASPVTSWYTDHPYRHAGYMQTSEFMQRFLSAYGGADGDYPNAAIFGALPNGTSAVIMVGLCCPRWTGPSTLEYGAVLLTEPQSSTQAAYFGSYTAVKGAAVTQITLNNPSLFIDAATPAEATVEDIKQLARARRMQQASGARDVAAASVSAAADDDDDGPAKAFYLVPVGCPKQGYLSVQPCGGSTTAVPGVVGGATVTDPFKQWLLQSEPGRNVTSGAVAIKAVGRSSCARALHASSDCSSNSVSVSDSSRVANEWNLVPTEDQDTFLIKRKGRRGCAAEYLGVSCGSGSVQLLPQYDSTATRSITWMLLPAGEGAKPPSCLAPSSSGYGAVSGGGLLGGPPDPKELFFVQTAASVTLKPLPGQGSSDPAAAGRQPSQFAFVLQVNSASAVTSWYTDRSSSQQAGYMQTAEVVQRFQSVFGADGDYPNAAIFGVSADGTPAVIMVGLCCPRWTGPSTLEYGAVLLTEPQSSTQAAYYSSYAAVKGAVPNVTLDSPSIFIDPATPLRMSPDDINEFARPQFQAAGAAVAVGGKLSLVAETVDYLGQDIIPFDSNSFTNLLTNGLSKVKQAEAVIIEMAAVLPQGRVLLEATQNLSYQLGNSRRGSAVSFGVGPSTPCPLLGLTTQWALNFVTNTGRPDSVVAILWHMRNSLLSWNSDVRNGIPLPEAGTIGVIQYLFDNYVYGCAQGSGSSTCPSSPTTLTQSPHYLAMNTLNYVLSQAIQAIELCNAIVADPYCPTGHSFSDPTYCSDTLGTSDLLNDIYDVIKDLAYPGRTNPWYYTMWRDYKKSQKWFYAASNGLANTDKEPFQAWPDARKRGYGFQFSEATTAEDPMLTPPLWVNMNKPVKASSGRVLTGISFAPTSCRWCGYMAGAKEGYGNVLNVAIQSCSLSADPNVGGWTLTQCTTRWTPASVPKQKKPPANVLQPLKPTSSSTNCAPVPKYVTQTTACFYDDVYPYQPQDSERCNVNPQYISLAPVVMPPNYVTVGAGLTMWICDNYPSSTSDGQHGPNAVLGLQLVGRRMVLDDEAANAALKDNDEIVVDNRGYCGTNILLAGVAGGVSWAGLHADQYYPPTDGKAQQYDALQVFVLQSGDRLIPSSSAWWLADGPNAVPSPPSFVQGAAFWLKEDRLSIGLITAPNPYYVHDLDFDVTLTTAPSPNSISGYDLADCQALQDRIDSPVVQTFIDSNPGTYYCQLRGGFAGQQAITLTAGKSFFLCGNEAAKYAPKNAPSCYVLWPLPDI